MFFPFEMLPITFKQYSVAIDEKVCSRCRICVSICECFEYDETRDVIRVNNISCKGCGICIASCPSSAIYHVYDDGIFYDGIEKREAVAFDCLNCSYEYAEEDGKLIFCIRRLNMGKAIEAVREGKVIKKCLLSDEKIDEKDGKILKMEEIVAIFKMEKKLKVE